MCISSYAPSRSEPLRSDYCTSYISCPRATGFTILPTDLCERTSGSQKADSYQKSSKEALQSKCVRMRAQGGGRGNLACRQPFG